jgi:hypothetical protein
VLPVVANQDSEISRIQSFWKEVNFFSRLSKETTSVDIVMTMLNFFLRERERETGLPSLISPAMFFLQTIFRIVILFIEWVPRVFSHGVKLPGREADHSPPSAEIKECVELYLHSPNMSSWRGV